MSDSEEIENLDRLGEVKRYTETNMFVCKDPAGHSIYILASCWNRALSIAEDVMLDEYEEGIASISKERIFYRPSELKQLASREPLESVTAAMSAECR